MAKEKHIEEMTVEFAKINCNPKGCYRCNLCDEYGSLELNCEDYLVYRTMAETFYNAGYRKASEVAREIFAEIGELINEYLYGRSYKHEFLTKIAELKKKYTEDAE